MAIEGYTKDELASLTPDELSALENDAGDSDGTLEEIAGGDDTDAAAVEAAATAQAEADATAAKPEAEGKPAADDKTGDAKPIEKPAAEAAKTETPAEEDEQLNLSSFKPETPDGADALRTELETRKADAFQKLMDGTMEPDDYKIIDKEVSAKLAELQSAAITDRVTAKIERQELEKAWNSELNATLKAGANDGIDYAKTPALKDEFMDLVGAFGVAADRKGMSDKNLEASKWALAQAHDVMRMRHGKAAAVADPVVPAAKTEAEKTPGQRHDLKTLGALPSADRTQVNDDVLSKFSTAEGEDIEKLMARMSPADVERLMASV